MAAKEEKHRIPQDPLSTSNRATLGALVFLNAHHFGAVKSTPKFVSVFHRKLFRLVSHFVIS